MATTFDLPFARFSHVILLHCPAIAFPKRGRDDFRPPQVFLAPMASAARSKPTPGRQTCPRVGFVCGYFECITPTGRGCITACFSESCR